MKATILGYTLGLRLRPLLISALMVSLGLSIWPIGVSQASTTIVVTSTIDRLNTDGFCTLREAIIAANKDTASGGGAGECAAGSGPDVISLPPGAYTLTRSDNGKEDSSSTGDLDIVNSVTIVGSGSVTINAASGFSDRIFHILGGSVTISGVTIKGGNVAGEGGGIYNKGALTLASSVVSNNKASARGGGVFNAAAGTLTVNNSAIANNTARDQGGGVYNAGAASLTNVTLSGNKITQTSSATYGGGGIYTAAGSISLVNVTVAHNAANAVPGSGGNLRRAGGTLTAKNTLVANAASGGNCGGTLTSLGYNLSSDASCVASFSQATDLNNTNPLIGALGDNGGATLTHALSISSPAVDRGTSAGCPATDQRGVSRPRGLACDIGAFEVEDPAQTGPLYTVISVIGTNDDLDDGVCSFSHCSLREAIQAANARPNGSTPDQIQFNLSGSPAVITLNSGLPAITGPVIVDGSTQPGGSVTIDGVNAGPGADCLTISGGGSTLRGLVVTRCPANGILLTTNGGNRIESNTLSLNGAAGVRVVSGAGNAIRSNLIFDNGSLGIDLGNPGAAPNDAGDPDAGANNLQNFPIITRAMPGTGSVTLQGRLNGAANTAFALEFFANANCDPSGFGEGATLLGSASATTDGTGDATFDAAFASAAPEGNFVSATATDAAGNTSEFSPCARIGPGNDVWTRALRLTPGGPLAPAAIDQFVDRQGQSRWYKFSVQPGGKAIVTLTGLPANYDLTLYKDIAAAYRALNSSQDLVRLGAEFAPDSFSPDSFSPDSFSPDSFSPDSFSPDSFSPDSFSPDSFSPDSFSSDIFSPDSFSPDSFSPDSFSPDSFSPDSFSPDSFSPDSFSPDPQAFANAQTRSVIGASAFEGTAGEGILVNTWDQTGDFYVRVRGRNGAFNPAATFHLEARLLTGACSGVNPIATPSSLSLAPGSYKTIILTDLGRVAGSSAELGTLQARLATFAERPEVMGVVVDVGADVRVIAANAQADANPSCPFAKNLVAGAIKEIVDRYRDPALNQAQLEYVVIVGSDDAIPFFRHPDHALLANEKNYVPPVRDDTASQASLKLGYVLSQEDYGARLTISLKDDKFPIPDLAVGRLTETAADATALLDAYLATPDGSVPQPASALVTGYDFLADGAQAIRIELEAGIGASADALITPRNLSPQDPAAWTADDLRAQLLARRHDLIFLAGHFSANSALAADYVTRLTSQELVSSTVDLTNAIVFSAGCHAGYNIVDAHGVPRVTVEPDWAQAFARKGATLIAGTGYQYGDTDFIEYSERLYLEVSQRLRAGSGPVSIGKALVAAKRAYLADTPQMRAIHEKALLEATLFGLPMLRVDLPQGRGNPPGDASIVAATTAYPTEPGQTLGLRFADVTIVPTLTLNSVLLSTVGSTQTVTATYLAGSNGVIANPAEPILPLEVRNVSVSGTVLRGVGFRAGAYTDLLDVLPLTDAPTTEIRSVHAPFLSDFFYPVRLWDVNYFEALANPGAGATRLVLIPAHFKSSESGASLGTLRRFDAMSVRLYYSDNFATYANGNIPALAGAPAIVRVSAVPDAGQVRFRVIVVGDPAAGVQEVWVTYAATGGPFAGQWQSLDLARNASDSALWEGTLDLNGAAPQDVRYIVQAVNGVGLVNLATNLGAYYVPGVDTEPTQPTALSLEVPVSSGPYGTQATFSAVLTNNSALAGQAVTFGLGPQSRQGTTDADGRATVTLSLLGLPGPQEVRASFAGTAEFIASADAEPFTITRQSTLLTLNPVSAVTYLNGDTGVVATLTDVTGRRLGEKTVFFVLTGGAGSYSVPVITDYAGRAPLGKAPLPRGSYSVNVYFSGSIPLDTGETLTLDDERYLPSTTTGSLSIVNRNPVAVADAYGVDEGGTLGVAAPGVLGNDSDADGDTLSASLSSGPAHGALTLNADGSFTYTPDAGFDGTDVFAYVASDGNGGTSTAAVTITVRNVNSPPVCSTAVASPVTLWPPDKTFYPVSVFGVTDPDGDAVTITITRIRQDEPVGTGGNSPDGRVVGVNLAEIRSERDGGGDGRVYHVFFTATDGRGGSCSGEVKVGVVPHDQSGTIDAIDGGPLYDSTVPG